MARVEDMASVPAVISIVSEGGKIILFGGKQLEAGGENLFPDNFKTQVFVSQSGPDHIPNIGFHVSKEYGERHGPCSTAVHFQAQGEIIEPTGSYDLFFGVSLNKVKVGTFTDKPVMLPPEFAAPSVIDANRKGADLVPLQIRLEVDNDLELITYPPVVARGPNYGLVHNDEPFDGGVTISKILSSSLVIAYIPRSHYASIKNALSHAEAADPIDPKRPFGIDLMVDYDREHLERISDRLFLRRRGVPVPVQPVTDWLHQRAAMVLGMGADTLLIQQAIENLAKQPFRATKGFIASLNRHLNPIERASENHQTNSEFEEYSIREIGKKRTRNMLCGRGTRKYAFDTDHEVVPPYPSNVVDILALAGASMENHLAINIISNTIGKLGCYSELVQSIVRALPDGILSIEAFPGAGKTTVTAAIDACLCLLSKDFKILVVAGQHAALDALNGNLHQQLTLSVTSLNRDMGQNHSEPVVQLPLVLLASGNEDADVSELVRIVESRYEVGPDPNRPNTLCELLLQLLDAGPHRLPIFSKAGLRDLAGSIRSQDSEGFRKLRDFVAGELTWAEANSAPVNKSQKMTATAALGDIMARIFPMVNVLGCTTATATKEIYSKFVQTADLCQNEEAGATSCPQIFAGWRGIGQPLILSGDSAQFGPYTHDFLQKKCIFWQFLATSTLDMIKRGGYPVFQLNTQHRAIHGQFHPVYENFYSDFKPILSPASQHPDNHPHAQRVEASFVADFVGLEPSPAGLILPMFIHVPDSVCEFSGKSKHCPQQTEAATDVVKKLIRHDVKPDDIMVIAAYRAEIMELRKTIPQDVLITTADAVQGQERSHVVFVFSTTKETGPGFTRDPKRLCVAMSRQKEFLALVGDIETVHYPSGRNDSKDLASIHNYFIKHRRVGNYERHQESIQDTAEIPEPSTTDVRDEEEDRLKAQVEAAIAALEDYKASRLEKSAAQSSTKPGPSKEEENITKPMTMEEEMDAWMRRASKLTPKAAANTGKHWGSSGNASGSNTSGGDPTDAGNSGHYANVCPRKESFVCYNCGEVGHMSRECINPKKDQCRNCQEYGHTKEACKNPWKPRDYSSVRCTRCKKLGHTVVKCDQPDPSKNFDSGFDKFDEAAGDRSSSKYSGW
ncbi:hypothetical protein SLS64_007413 [Diaporthe eres]